jgi:zinc protease
LELGDEIDGLRLVLQRSPAGAATCSMTYVGPAGWGYDPAGREGTARLVNQLMTSAVGTRDRVALSRALDALGATISHHCAPESGEVTIWGPSDEWERLLGLLADAVLRPRFAADDLARTRRQFHERQLREITQPGARAERELLSTIFPRRHPYADTGLGSARSVERISRADLVRFHRAHYSSGEAVLVVTTPVRRGRIERLARRLFRDFTTARPAALAIPPVPPRGTRTRSIVLTGRTQVEIRVGGPSIPRGAPEYPAAFLANEVLGGRPLLSRLFQHVREERGLAYHASSGLEAMRFGGYWFVQAGTGAERWRKVVPLLREELLRLDRTPVGVAELETIRESAIGEIPLALESTAEAHELAVDVAYHRLPLDYWARWPEQLRTVRPNAVRDAAATALDGRRAVTVLAGPVGGA